jgi:DNA invertase Pin-like site-specific DNA recombinase
MVKETVHAAGTRFDVPPAFARWTRQNDLSGDTLVVVWKLDRLGRSLRDLMDVAEALRDRGVVLRSLTEHIDTSTAAGKMLYAVLGAVARFERDVLRERTILGIRAARVRGERLGRPPVLTPMRVREARLMLERGESPSHVARILRVARSTLYRALIR